MYIAIVPNRNSPPAVLLRESVREGGKIVKKTLANLSGLPPERIAAVRLALAGKAAVPAESMLEVLASRPHGHVKAVKTAMDRLGMAHLLSASPCRANYARSGNRPARYPDAAAGAGLPVVGRRCRDAIR